MTRSIDALGVVLAIVLGLLIGPILAYGLSGDYWHSINVHVDQRLALAVAIVLSIGALVNALRFRSAGLMGAITGLVGGIGMIATALLPWVIFAYQKRQCGNAPCPLVTPGDLTQNIILAGLFIVGLSTLAGYSLAALLAAMRARFA